MHRRTALVTGANRGVGFAVARALAERDYAALVSQSDGLQR
jgi:NAD(P)-dependent dehydrogenase (short-subunit alcohol dehydrogenase family)